MQIKEGAETFLLEGNNGKAVLLLHGYTGTTSEMRPLGEYLHGLGYTVLCPRLPGHGTSVEDLKETVASQWVAAAQLGYAILAKKYQRIYCVILSTICPSVSEAITRWISIAKHTIECRQSR